MTVSPSLLLAVEREHARRCAALAAFCGARSLPYFRAEIDVPVDELLLRVFRAGGFVA